MRTTLTLDDDIAAKLQAESRRSGRSFPAVVTEALRHGLVANKPLPTRRPFKVVARDLGARRPGLNFDSVADLLEQVEGPWYR